jgi:hypothetical protein
LRPWLKPFAGYLLSGLALALGHPVTRDRLVPGLSLAGLARRGVYTALIELVLLGIIWIWLGSKLFRGHAPIGASVRGVGEALYLPSAAAVLFVSLPYRGMHAGTLPALALTGILLSLAAWAAARVALAVQQLNGFGRARTWGVVLWPLVPIALMCGPAQVLFWRVAMAALGNR